jgi:hypothetical protein
MVFCQSDTYGGNYIIDADNRITAIDFADSSIVPASLARFAIGLDHLGCYIAEWVNVPLTEGVDNRAALSVTYNCMVMSSSFDKVGKRTPGGDEETQKRFDLPLLEAGILDPPIDFGPTLGELAAMGIHDPFLDISSKFPQKPRRPRVYLS